MALNLRHLSLIVLATLVLFGCNYAGGATTAPAAGSPTIYVQTLSALQTRAALTATSQGFSGVFPTSVVLSPVPVTGNLTGTPGKAAPTDATILNDTLCWLGPGPRFETISAIFKGIRVAVVGRAAIPGWVIVQDPIYLVPCWVQATDVRIDPTVNMAALPLFNPPQPPVTNTATLLPQSTATFAPTNAPTGGPTSTFPPPTAPAPTDTPQLPTVAPPSATSAPPADTQPAPTSTP